MDGWLDECQDLIKLLDSYVPVWIRHKPNRCSLLSNLGKLSVKLLLFTFGGNQILKCCYFACDWDSCEIGSGKSVVFLTTYYTITNYNHLFSLYKSLKNIYFNEIIWTSFRTLPYLWDPWYHKLFEFPSSTIASHPLLLYARNKERRAGWMIKKSPSGLFFCPRKACG